MKILILVALVAAFGTAHGCFTVTTDSDGTGGTISPLTQGGQYLANQNCAYTITQFQPYGLLLWFTKMDLETDDSWDPCESNFYSCLDQCDENDWVSITDVATNTEVTRRCGTKLPDYIYRTTGAAYIYFRTDRIGQRTGFTLNFKIDPDTEPCVGTTSISSAGSGFITNYARALDGKYRANEDCKWKVTVPSSYDTIRFSFNKMDIDGSCSANAENCSCPNDWVSIYDGDTDGAPVIAQRCGFSVPALNFYTSKSGLPTAFVRFKTDSTVQYKGFNVSYQGCKQPCETTTSTTTTTTTTPEPTIEWPRVDAMVGFWPLGSDNGLKDISPYKHKCAAGCHGEVDYSSGPFGDASTSHRPSSTIEREPILTTSAILDPASSYTVSLWVRVPTGATGGLLSLFSNVQDFAFDLVTNSQGRPRLQVRASASTTSDVYGPYDVIQPDGWSYISAVFNAQMCTLSLYGQFGELYLASYKPKLCSAKSAPVFRSLRIGVSSLSDNSYSYLNESVSVSCVTLFSAALTADEISNNAEVCRIPHGSSPCGAPRIPLSVIPSDTTTTTSYGQFPWAASLRYRSNHICSAAILNPYYLLTAASCFEDSDYEGDFEARAGDHNVGFNESYETRHAVAKIWTHPNYNISGNDIAVVELSSPINLANFYVNTICLPTAADNQQGTGYFYGWGVNGRSAQVSATLPRYVVGSVQSDTACSSSWGSGFVKGLNVCFKSNNPSYTNVPCTGDEGGPLVVPGNTTTDYDARLVPIGIYGRRYNNDCTHSAPAIFTKLLPYVNGVKIRMACNLPGHNYPDNCPINYA